MEKIRFRCEMKNDAFRERFINKLLSSGYFTMGISDEEEAAFKSVVFTDRIQEESDEEFIVYLSDEIASSEIRGNTLYAYKYLKFPLLLQMVFRGCKYVMNSDAEAVTPGCKTVSVYSFSGGSGVSEISIGLTKALYRSGYKPIYLDLTPFSMQRLGNGEMGSEAMLSAIYSIKRGRYNDISAFVTSEEGVDTIRVPALNVFIDELDYETLEKVGRSAYLSGYDIMILDIGNHIEKRNMEIIEGSNVEILVIPGGMKSDPGEAYGIEGIQFIGKEKSIRVINDPKGVGGEASREDYNSPDIEGIDVVLPFSERLSVRTLDTDFGNGIKFLAEIVGGRIAE